MKEALAWLAVTIIWVLGLALVLEGMKALRKRNK